MARRVHVIEKKQYNCLACIIYRYATSNQQGSPAMNNSHPYSELFILNSKLYLAGVARRVFCIDEDSVNSLGYVVTQAMTTVQSNQLTAPTLRMDGCYPSRFANGSQIHTLFSEKLRFPKVRWQPLDGNIRSHCSPMTATCRFGLSAY